MHNPKFAIKESDVCKSDKHILIALTRAWHLMGNYETVTLAFDGTAWVSIKLKGNWANDEVETSVVKPIVGYDSVLTELKSNNIFLLDDQDKLSLKGTVDDGTDYTLSYKVNGKCGRYGFRNPEYYKEMNPDVTALDNYIGIVKVLFEGFANK